MPNSHPSDFRRNLRREIAGYFLVVLAALPLHFALWTWIVGEEDLAQDFVHRTIGYSIAPLVGIIFVSKLRLRYKLALTFLVVLV